MGHLRTRRGGLDGQWPESPIFSGFKRTFTGLRLLSGSDRVTRTSDGVVHPHNQPDCGGGPSRDPGRLAKVAGRITTPLAGGGCRDDPPWSLSCFTKNQPCSCDDGLLLVHLLGCCTSGSCASCLPTPPLFAIGGVVLLSCRRWGVIDRAEAT